MPKVIALKQHIYDGVIRKKDETYEVPHRTNEREPDMVATLLHAGYVKLAEEAEKSGRNSKREYRRRDLEAEK